MKIKPELYRPEQETSLVKVDEFNKIMRRRRIVGELVEFASGTVVLSGVCLTLYFLFMWAIFGFNPLWLLF